MQWKTLDEEDVVSTCSLAQQGGPPGEAQSPAFNCSALLRVNLLFYLWATCVLPVGQVVLSVPTHRL